MAQLSGRRIILFWQRLMEYTVAFEECSVTLLFFVFLLFLDVFLFQGFQAFFAPVRNTIAQNALIWLVL